MDQPSQTYTSIIDAVRGVKGVEIDSPIPPIPINPIDAESLSAYISSFWVPTYRTLWAEIDNQTAAPKPIIDELVSVPVFTNELPPLEVIKEKWEVRIWARSGEDSPETPIFGFTMRPKISNLTLYTCLWLLLPTTERDKGWGVYFRASDGSTGSLLDWRSRDFVEDGDVVIRTLGDVPVVATGETDLPYFPTRRYMRPQAGRDNYSDTTLSSRMSSWDINSNVEIPHRDRYCQGNGRSIRGKRRTFGLPSVAHIVPSNRPDLVDKIRWSLDPRYWSNRPSSRIRQIMNNHPGNNLYTSKPMRRLYNDSYWTIDPFHRFLTPMAIRYCQGLHDRRPPDERCIDFICISLVFPSQPDQDNSESSPNGDGDNSPPDADEHKTSLHESIPAVTSTALLMNLISMLRAICMIVTAKSEDPVAYTRPPTDAVLDRVRRWLQAPHFGVDDPLDPPIGFDSTDGM